MTQQQLPTKRQAQVLQLLRDGWQARYGHAGDCWLVRNDEVLGIPDATIEALLASGWLRRTTTPGSVPQFRLSLTGQSALRVYEARRRKVS